MRICQVGPRGRPAPTNDDEFTQQVRHYYDELFELSIQSTDHQNHYQEKQFTTFELGTTEKQIKTQTEESPPNNNQDPQFN